MYSVRREILVRLCSGAISEGYAIEMSMKILPKCHPQFLLLKFVGLQLFNPSGYLECRGGQIKLVTESIQSNWKNGASFCDHEENSPGNPQSQLPNKNFHPIPKMTFKHITCWTFMKIGHGHSLKCPFLWKFQFFSNFQMSHHFWPWFNTDLRDPQGCQKMSLFC